MKRTVLIVQGRDKLFGGGEYSLLELVKVFNKLGIHSIVTVPKNRELARELKKIGAETVVFNPMEWIGGNRRETHEYNQDAYHLCRALGLKSYDISFVVTNSMFIPTGAFFAGMYMVPHIWYVREMGKLYKTDHSFKFDLGDKRTYEAMNTGADAFIVDTKFMKDVLISKGIDGHKIWQIYEPVVVPKFKVKKVKNKKFTCVILGRIEKMKRQLDAVKAVKILSNTKLEIIGTTVADWPESWEYGGKVLKYKHKYNLNNKIKFMGRVKNQYEHIYNADALLMCSKVEAMGRVTIEAMKLGTPVIGTNSGGTKEILKNEKTGLLYEPCSVKSLAFCIALLRTDKELRTRITKQAKIRANEVFNYRNYSFGLKLMLKHLRLIK